MSKRPTIHELEEILRRDEESRVLILSNAMKTLRTALKDDEYRQAWVANIACAVMDEAPEVDYDTRQKIAERFLGWLCVEPE